MSVPSQRPPQPPRHSQLSTSIAPGLVPGFPQHHGLSQEDIDGLFSFDAFPQQNFDEWSHQVSADEMWQQDHGLFEGFWASGAELDHQGASPMSISGHIGPHPHAPRRVSTPNYPTDGMPSGLRLEYDGNDELHLGGEGAGDRQERQRSEATDNNSTGAESTKADSPSEQKRKMQNRQAQRAFRERKVKYVQDLEKQVKDLLLYAESLKHENQMLRARGQWLSNQLKSLHRQTSKRSPS